METSSTNSSIPPKKKNFRWLFYLIGAVVLINVIGQIITANKTPNKDFWIGSSSFGYNKESWPLTGVDSVQIKCEDNRVIITTLDGVTYAVNGLAQTVAKERGWKKIDEIHIFGKDIGPIIKKGLTMCEEAEKTNGD